MNLAAQQDDLLANTIKENLALILNENQRLAGLMNFDQFPLLIRSIKKARTIFLTGTGRTGFAMRAFAMRLMHLGLNVHFVGETTTPAIGRGDLLIAASGSGTTSSIVKAAEKAQHSGADVFALTTNPSSLLAKLSTAIIEIPAAEKTDHENSKSKQYAGSLFEQFILLVTDAVFAELWKIDGSPAAELWARHANME
jgi:6-phospho-3-hexuloisomerase